LDPQDRIAELEAGWQRWHRIGNRALARSPNQLPVQVIIRDGQVIAVNNRSLAALRRAGLEPTVTIDVTSDATIFQRVVNRLDEMGGQPSDVIRIRGAGPNASSTW
jgi:hypothetical protein